MRILGVDPGYGRVGYGVVDRRGGALIALRHGVIETSSKLDLPARLKQVHDSVAALIESERPDCLATERLLFSANRTTGIGVASALGVVLLAAAERGVPWSEYTPPQVKLAVTGSGRAAKSQVQYMVTRLLRLQECPKPDDVADALAVAICHALRAGIPTP